MVFFRKPPPAAPQSLLTRHLEYLLEHDRWFISAWDSWHRRRRERFLATAAALDRLAAEPDLEARFAAAHRTLRALFLVVPEKAIELGGVRMSSWINFAADDIEKAEVLAAAREHFELMFSRLHRRRPRPYLDLYGGLKDIRHVTVIMPATKPESSSLSRALGDLWDVVRLRAVVASAADVIALSLMVWEHHLDDMIKVRNYYLNPKTLNRWPTHPYRAVHLQVPILERMVELQIMTDVGEAISYLDHAIVFKRRLDVLSEEHLGWLTRVRCAGLLLELARWPARPPRASFAIWNTWKSFKASWYRPARWRARW